MPKFLQIQAMADDEMRRGEYRHANERYAEAWNDYAECRRQAAAAGELERFDDQHSPLDAFWLLMSGVNAQFLAADYENCLDTAFTAFNLFKELGLVVGNPLFHLRVGQASFELDPDEPRDPQGTTIDNLARALICGGIEIFRHEAPRYLELATQVLRPPQGYASWLDAHDVGCSLEKLNGATGILAETLTSKYGAPPPYPEP